MFNDPFDHRAGFTLDIDDRRFARLFTASIERVVSGSRRFSALL